MTEDMVRARFTGYNHYHNGEKLEQGDVVELTPEHYTQWSYQFERLSEPSTDEDSEETVTDEAETSSEPDLESQDVDAPLNPGEYTIGDLQDEITNGDFSDEDLEAMFLAESAGENRKGAKKVIREAGG